MEASKASCPHRCDVLPVSCLHSHHQSGVDNTYLLRNPTCTSAPPPPLCSVGRRGAPRVPCHHLMHRQAYSGPGGSILLSGRAGQQAEQSQRATLLSCSGLVIILVWCKHCSAKGVGTAVAVKDSMQTVCTYQEEICVCHRCCYLKIVLSCAEFSD